jgi:hypothetical protein
MKEDFVLLGAGALPQNERHDEFLALCANSASGELTEEEQKKLNDHLAVCASCREALQQYEAVVDQAISSIAATENHQEVDPGPGWSQKKAEKRLFDRLERELGRSATSEFGKGNEASGFPLHRVPLPSESAWSNVWMLYAAGILLFTALGLFMYRVGIHRGGSATKMIPPPPAQTTAPDQTALEAQLSDAGHERAIAHAQIAQRDRTISDLRHQLAKQSDEINQLRNTQQQLQAQLQSDDQNKTEIATQQAELTQTLEKSENNSQALQAKLDSLAQQSAQDAIRAKTSEAKVNDLTKLLQDRESAIEQQEQMLAHDRDIRELMGARDLYIAEVYDVGDSGQTKKPYGRVFYTRGKSLIFYAYDLDQQQQLKRASTFQAWGRRGPDRQHAVNLGIFYEDNLTKKRWVMKCDDTKSLAQIDGVFVTVEPNGGSHRPSDKTLLFAYLKLNPNHP